ncbi:MAG: cytochrome c [Flavobacteriaceae bacterium]|nr:cytochrome c [Flavobacteriaceae bacterium]
MKNILKIFTLATALLVFSCGSEEKKEDKPQVKIGQADKKIVVKKDANPPETDLIDLNNKGIGPIKSLEFGPVDNEMAAKGEEIFKRMCMACHKPDRKFIGPAPKGVFERRSPEWVMNMILNPEEMVQKDPVAKQLLIEYNGSPMANQGLTEEEARAVVEYFRTL